MDPLRVVLIVCGVLLIAGIYLWERHKQRRAERARPEDEERPHAPEPDPFAPPGDEAAPGVDLAGYDIDEDLGEETPPGETTRVVEVRARRPAAGAEAPAEAPAHGEAVAPLAGIAPRRDAPEQLDLSGLDLKAPAREAADGTRAPREAGRAEDARRRRPEPATSDEEELVVAVTVMAPAGERFSGPALREALENAGMRPGEMRIYHRYAPRGADGEAQAPLFSAANVVKPGHLEAEALGELETPGLALFMRLPGPPDPNGAFQTMLDTAKRVADELHGHVCDDSRAKLTAQRANHLRERIGDFARRQMLKA